MGREPASSQRHLSLRHERDQLAVLGLDPCQPDLRAAAAMDGRAAADEDRAGLRAGDEIRLALERRRSLRAVGQVDEGRRAAERVGEAHDRPAVREAAERAEVGSDDHARGDGVRLDARELDAEQLCERQRIGVDAVQKRHGPPPSRTGFGHWTRHWKTALLGPSWPGPSGHQRLGQGRSLRAIAARVCQGIPATQFPSRPLKRMDGRDKPATTERASSLALSQTD
jgi:hypothetical protein